MTICEPVLGYLGAVSSSPRLASLLKDAQLFGLFFFFSRRRRHTRLTCDWSSDVCSSDLTGTLSSTVAESKTVSATIGGVGITQTATVVVNPGAPANLNFVIQPASAASGASIAPPIQVEIRDALNNRVTTAANQVSLAILNNAGPDGTLSGTVTNDSPVSGIATISNASIDKTGTGYTLSATATGLTGATSSAFNITAGTVSAALTTVGAASPITAGGTGSTITVTAKDGAGNPVGSATVVIAVSGTGNTFSQPAATNASGVTTTTLTSTVAESKTVSATVDGVAITQTATVVVNAGAPSAAQSTVAATSPVTASSGASQSTITVTAKDALGNPIGGATVVLAATGSGNTLNQPVGLTNASGVATGTLSSTVAESKTVSATINGTGVTQTAAVVVNPGTPANLNFVVQPSSAGAATSITPAIQVEIRDALNNRVTTASNQISLAILNNAGGGTLSGTVANVSPVSGVASFGNASIDKAGTGYTLSATASGLTSATSSAFTITAGAATHLAFSQQPSSAGSGATIAPAVTVTALDGAGNVATTFANQVSLAFANNAGGGTLTGGAATTPVSGVATFSGLSIDKAGTGYTLGASATGVTGVTSAAFNITAGTVSATQTTVGATSPITAGGTGSTITVTAKDGAGNPVAGATVVIAVSGTGNTFSQPAVTNASGVATTTLTSTVAESKTVSATVNSVAITQTATVVVNPGAPSASQSTVTAGSPITASSGASQSTITVTAKDANGNLIVGATVVLATTGTGNTLTQPAGGVSGAGGVATGTLSSTVAESKTVSATIGGVGITQTATVVVNPGAPANLNFVVQPASAASGASIAPPMQVEVRDALNNRVTTATNQVSLAILNNAGPGGTLSGTVTNVSPVSGIASFSNASIDKAGTGYTLSATSTGLTAATSSAFNITAGAVSAAQSTVAATSPITTDGATSTITVTAKDGAGNPIAGATVVLAASGTGNTLTQPVGTTNASGVATGTLSSTVAESKTVSATINAVSVTQTATVVVTSGAVSAAQSTVAATSPITASSGASQSSITVTAKDAAGN